MASRWLRRVALGLVGTAVSALADFTLVRDGQPQAAIVVGSAAPEVTEAAESLQTFLERMSTARLPVVAARTDAGGRAAWEPSAAAGAVVLCLTEDLPALAPPGPVPALAEAVRHDGFALFCDGATRLFVVAAQPVGLVYGAHDLLERLGCRWYFPGSLGEEIPVRATFALPALSSLQNPSMVDRNMWYAYGGRPDWQKEGYRRWQRRNKMGGLRFSAGHNLTRVVPPARYGNEHPEYFPLWGGKRHVPAPDEAHNWQPCTSNPEVVAVAVAAATKSFTENPAQASFSLSPNDGYGWCECEACRAQDPPEQRTARNQFKGRRMLLFVNAVARELARAFPDKYLAWYAYAGTVEPPTDVKAEANVLTLLAHYGYVGCNVHAMADRGCELNQKFLVVLDGWDRVADHLMIREYWSLLCGEEDAMARVCAGYSLAEDIPLLVRRGFIGASAESEPEYGSSAINFYLAAKLMWQADQPLEPILEDYYRGMYGAAAGPMREVFEGIVSRCRERSHRGHFFADDDYTEMAAALAAAAATAALSDTQRGRIQMTRDFLTYTTLLHQYGLRPSKETRRQIEELVAGVEARQEFTLDTVMHRHTFAAAGRAAAIKDPAAHLVGRALLAVPGGTPAPAALKQSPVGRGRHVFALVVPPGGRLQADIELRRLGRYTNPVSWVVLDEAGKTVAAGEATLEENGTVDLPEAAPGTYTLVADAGSNALRVTSPLTGLALVAREALPLLGSQPPLYFLVPAGTTSFTVRLESDAPGETGRLQVYDPEGQVVAEGDTVATGLAQLDVRVAPNLAGKAWSVKAGPAGKGVCEDLRLTLSAPLPPFLAVAPERVLIKAP